VDDPANSVGYYTSIDVGTDGLPVIGYHDGTAFALKVARCGDVSCPSSSITIVHDASANRVGLYTSIAIGNDGFPVISYYDQTVRTLNVAHCGTRSCQ